MKADEFEKFWSVACRTLQLPVDAVQRESYHMKLGGWDIGMLRKVWERIFEKYDEEKFRYFPTIPAFMRERNAIFAEEARAREDEKKKKEEVEVNKDVNRAGILYVYYKLMDGELGKIRRGEADEELSMKIVDELRVKIKKIELPGDRELYNKFCETGKFVYQTKTRGKKDAKQGD
jgi:hypothetical protein